MEEDVAPQKCSARIRSLSDSHVSLMRDRPSNNACATIQSIKGDDGTKITKYQWYHAKKEEQCLDSDPKYQSIKASSAHSTPTNKKESKGSSSKTKLSTVSAALSQDLKGASTVSAAQSKDLKTPAQREIQIQLEERARDTPLSPSSWYAQTYEQQSHLPKEALDALHELTVMQADAQLKREDLMTHKVTAQLYPFIPFDDDGNVTSLGSILHSQGMCKPCAFVKKNRCHKKDLCLHCHFEHDIPQSTCSRKSKSRRMRLRCANSGYH
jgi:hypothetical protein